MDGSDETPARGADDRTALAVVLGVVFVAVLFVVLLLTRQFVFAALVFLFLLPLGSAAVASFGPRRP